MLALVVFCGAGVVLGVLMNSVYESLRSIVARIHKRRAGVYPPAGLSPMTPNAQIEANTAQARFMTEPKSVEQRLAELDDLCQRGVISDSERAEARIRVLAAC